MPSGFGTIRRYQYGEPSMKETTRAPERSTKSSKIAEIAEIGETGDGEFGRLCEAYLEMALMYRLHRPAGPSDLVGNLLLDREQIKDIARLHDEAREYARRFIEEENTRSFRIGCTNYSTNRATVFTIEAARVLCSALDDDLAIRLLQMAIKEIRKSKRLEHN